MNKIALEGNPTITKDINVTAMEDLNPENRAMSLALGLKDYVQTMIESKDSLTEAGKLDLNDMSDIAQVTMDQDDLNDVVSVVVGDAKIFSLVDGDKIVPLALALIRDVDEYDAIILGKFNYETKTCDLDFVLYLDEEYHLLAQMITYVESNLGF